MAKTSWIERDARKKRTVAKYAVLRTELKAKNDYVGLTLLPRDASPTRLVNRCKVDRSPPGLHPPLRVVPSDFP